MKLLHEDATAQALDVLRFYIFGIWFCIVLADPFMDLTYLSPEVFHPTGFLIKILVALGAQEFLFQYPVLVGLKIILLISVLFVLCKKYLNISLVVSTFFLIIYQGYIRGFGHLNHAEIALLLSAIILTIFSIADSMTEASKSKEQEVAFNSNSLPFITITLLICMTYVLIGILRFWLSGIDIYFSDTMFFWIIDEAYSQQYTGIRLEYLVMEHAWLRTLLKMGYPVVSLFEILAPFILINKHLRYSFIAVMLPFHIFVWLFMDIFFWENIVLYVMFFNLTPFFAPKKIDKMNPIVYFDGVCSLCNHYVTIILKQDTTGVFRFAPLQGEAGKSVLKGMDQSPSQWSIVLEDEKGLHYRSDAVLRILSGLGGISKLSSIFYLLPQALRDIFYNVVAKYRYQWFGKRGQCRIPTPEERARFLP